MKRYARQQVTGRLDRLEQEIERARLSQDEDAVHDLRVSKRRFMEALKLFGEFLGDKACRKARKQVKAVMRDAGQVRNRDIALAMARKAGLDETSGTVQELLRQRQEAAVVLKRHIMQFRKKRRIEKWKADLV
jgi:CHAD domain-containing protein